MAVDEELLNAVTWKIPNALVLVGSAAGGDRNGMTTSWVTQLSMEPVLIGVGVDNKAVTHRLITDGGCFSVNLWSSEDTKVFVKFSKPATDDGETLNGRSVRAEVTGAPVFDEAIAWMDCEVRQAHDLGTLVSCGDDLDSEHVFWCESSAHGRAYRRRPTCSLRRWS